MRTLFVAGMAGLGLSMVLIGCGADPAGSAPTTANGRLNLGFAPSSRAATPVELSSGDRQQLARLGAELEDDDQLTQALGRGPFVPLMGTYDVERDLFATNTCGFPDDPPVSEAEAELSAFDPQQRSYRVVVTDLSFPDDPFVVSDNRCSLKWGRLYGCDVEEFVMEFEGNTLTNTIHERGIWLAADRFLTLINQQISCTGDQCPTLFQIAEGSCSAQSALIQRRRPAS
jgi:hypothetical protein